MNHRTITHHRPEGGALDIRDAGRGRTFRCRDFQFTYEDGPDGRHLVSISTKAAALDGQGRPERRGGLLRRIDWRAYELDRDVLSIAPEVAAMAASDLTPARVPVRRI